MKFLVDENIPLGREFFGPWGEVQTAAGRALTANDLRDVDVLIVRSVTKVNEQLLSGTPVKFVGSTTIGTDHLDIPYLEAAGIGWGHAPGSNAWGVVQWVMSALGTLIKRDEKAWSELNVGIVGYGNIGSRLAPILSALGVSLAICDPPLVDKGVQPREIDRFCSLEELLHQSNAVTLHVPLTKSGPHPTENFLTANELALLPEGAWLLNSARGGLLVESDLLGSLVSGRLGVLALDAWPNEPKLSPELLHRADLGTPHIAGYSVEGKINGIRMVAECVAEYFDLPMPDQALGVNESGEVIDWEKMSTGGGSSDTLQNLLLQTYNIKRDSASLKALLTNPGSIPEQFDLLRRNYPPRHEFSHYTLQNAPAELANALTAMGFKLR
jgi:erythronate-4-phosphate dehydrogenase